MTSYRSRLIARQELAEGTAAFHFEKPDDFAFKPGQAIELILPELGGENRHAFSLVSAPFEDRLTIATRLRDSAFKRALGSLPAGAAAEIDGPFGALTLHNDRSRPALFVAGGIGITPFVCMLRHAAKLRLAQRFVLVYSNRRPEDAAFLAELEELAAHGEGFELVATMTQMSNSKQPWVGRTGAVDSELLSQVLGGLSSAVCYVAGPPAMVAAMRGHLNRAGADDDDIRSEDFFGY
ncbi:MAG: FAD-dependent oxidoreductase [Rhodocyclaceae bacterium]|nr:FAD-dependent oxidoreductase [Rhodocyclaceae bacterium]